MKSTQFALITVTVVAATGGVSAANLILPINDTLDINLNPEAILAADVENGGGLGWGSSNNLPDGIGVGSIPNGFLGGGLPAGVQALQFLFGGGDSGSGPVPGIIGDFSPVINPDYFAQISGGNDCRFNPNNLLDEDPNGDPALYPGKFANQDVTPGDHFFSIRITRISDSAEYFAFLKYSSNPDYSMNVLSAGLNTTSGEPASCPENLGLIPAALGMGLVMIRHARSRRTAIPA